MQFTLSLLFTALATVVVAAPQGGTIAGSIELFTDPNYEGASTTILTHVGACVKFPDGFHNVVSSVQPLETWSCNLYTDDSCQSAAFLVTGPTPTFPKGDDNKFNSVICTPNA